MRLNNTKLIPKLIHSALFLATLILTACGGGGSGGAATATATLSIGGSVTSLSGTVKLLNNTGDTLTITANATTTPFTFATKVASGYVYSVTVTAQPTGQNCTVTSGGGTATVNVTNVAISCTVTTPSIAYTIGGKITGLTSSIAVANNVSDQLNIAADGTFTFNVTQQTGTAYNFSIVTLPSGVAGQQPCTSTYGTGTVGTANVTNISVICGPAGHSGGGITSIFITASTLSIAHSQHTATLLPTGKVLVTGGLSFPGVLATTAEIYDPVAVTWTVAAAPLTLRQSHTATLLTNGLTNGKVLVAGGANAIGTPLATVDFYDPVTGAWTAAPNINFVARKNFTATQLLDGTVLVVGGVGSVNVSIKNVELYDPVANTWTVKTNLGTPRSSHTATLLPNGKVLVAGGADASDNPLGSSELYDPVANTWTPMANLNVARSLHTASLLPDGTVLIAGGTTPGAAPGSFVATNSAEIYTPPNSSVGLTGVWTPQTAFTSSGCCQQHAATLMPSSNQLYSNVLLTGGATTALTSVSGVVKYDPSQATNPWSVASSLQAARSQHTATLLSNGKLLVVGGWAAGAALNTAELYW